MHLATVLCLCILQKPNGACPVCVLCVAGVLMAGGAFVVLLCDFHVGSLGLSVESVLYKVLCDSKRQPFSWQEHSTLQIVHNQIGWVTSLWLILQLFVIFSSTNVGCIWESCIRGEGGENQVTRPRSSHVKFKKTEDSCCDKAAGLVRPGFKATI